MLFPVTLSELLILQELIPKPAVEPIATLQVRSDGSEFLRVAESLTVLLDLSMSHKSALLQFWTKKLIFLTSSAICGLSIRLKSMTLVSVSLRSPSTTRLCAKLKKSKSLSYRLSFYSAPKEAKYASSSPNKMHPLYISPNYLPSLKNARRRKRTLFS